MIKIDVIEFLKLIGLKQVKLKDKSCLAYDLKGLRQVRRLQHIAVPVPRYYDKEDEDSEKIKVYCGLAKAIKEGRFLFFGDVIEGYDYIIKIEVY